MCRRMRSIWSRPYRERRRGLLTPQTSLSAAPLTHHSIAAAAILLLRERSTFPPPLPLSIATTSLPPDGTRISFYQRKIPLKTLTLHPSRPAPVRLRRRIGY